MKVQNLTEKMKPQQKISLEQQQYSIQSDLQCRRIATIKYFDPLLDIHQFGDILHCYRNIQEVAPISLPEQKQKSNNFQKQLQNQVVETQSKKEGKKASYVQSEDYDCSCSSCSCSCSWSSDLSQEEQTLNKIVNKSATTKRIQQKSFKYNKQQKDSKKDRNKTSRSKIDKSCRPLSKNSSFCSVCENPHQRSQKVPSHRCKSASSKSVRSISRSQKSSPGKDEILKIQQQQEKSSSYLRKAVASHELYDLLQNKIDIANSIFQKQQKIIYQNRSAHSNERVHRNYSNKKSHIPWGADQKRIDKIHFQAQNQKILEQRMNNLLKQKIEWNKSKSKEKQIPKPIVDPKSQPKPNKVQRKQKAYQKFSEAQQLRNKQAFESALNQRKKEELKEEKKEGKLKKLYDRYQMEFNEFKAKKGAILQKKGI